MNFEFVSQFQLFLWNTKGDPHRGMSIDFNIPWEISRHSPQTFRRKLRKSKRHCNCFMMHFHATLQVFSTPLPLHLWWYSFQLLAKCHLLCAPQTTFWSLSPQRSPYQLKGIARKEMARGKLTRGNICTHTGRSQKQEHQLALECAFCPYHHHRILPYAAVPQGFPPDPPNQQQPTNWLALTLCRECKKKSSIIYVVIDRDFHLLDAMCELLKEQSNCFLHSFQRPSSWWMGVPLM